MAEDWSNYQKLVLSELERLNRQVEMVGKQIHANQREIEVIKVKSGILGSISAVIVVIISSFIEYIRKI